MLGYSEGMRLFWVFTAVSAILLTGFVWVKRQTVSVKHEVVIGENIFSVEIADTDDERIRGLSNKTSLGKDEGMLFEMESREGHVFWMKEMRFPLDFVWIDGDIVVDISENIPISKDQIEIPKISPKYHVNRVLEINAGEVARRGISIGDTVTYR